MVKVIPQGGHTANKQGRVLEDFVRNIVIPHGYPEITYEEWIKKGEPVSHLVYSVPYTTIYNTKGRTEFLLIEEDKQTRIECKWQQSSGSVDEKYPYLLENMKTVPEEYVIILLDGNGYKPQAREWLDKHCKLCKDKSIILMNMQQFMKWANKTL